MKDTLIVKLQNGCWALGFLALSVSASAAESLDAPPDARLDELKREASAEVESMRKFTQVAVDTIFSYGELGFQEFETSRYVTGLLAENGFDVEMGMAGMPTAWMARWGSGEPVIAFGSDIDGIPKSSQKPGVAYHDPIIEGAPGHGEGHNSGQAVNVTGGTRSEEDHGARGNSGNSHSLAWSRRRAARLESVVRAGRLLQKRRCLCVHARQPKLGARAGARRSGNGLVSVEYTFRGESSHSASAPWKR